MYTVLRCSNCAYFYIATNAETESSVVYNESSTEGTSTSVTSRIPSMDGLQICYEYQYMVPPSEQAERSPAQRVVGAWR